MPREIFISHCWKNDLIGRDNHKRCLTICNKLIKKGYSTWFDEYDMVGNIDSNIIKGINDCKVMIICLSEAYCEKIEKAIHRQIPNDNCFKEWNYGLFKEKIIIPIIMEPETKNRFLQGEGVVPMYLNTTMFVDFSESIDDELDFLYKTLRKHQVYTFKEKKFYKIKSNFSFSDLLNALRENISPRSPIKIQLSPKKKRFKLSSRKIKTMIRI